MTIVIYLMRKRNTKDLHSRGLCRKGREWLFYPVTIYFTSNAILYIYIFVQKGGIVIIRGIYMLLNRMAIIKMGINNYIRYIYLR